MKTYKGAIILLNFLLLLGFFIWSVFQKEQTLQHGTQVLLELAPVDPRSLMQGDYMSLRYAIAREDAEPSRPKGYYVVQLDSNKVAHKIRMQERSSPIGKDELLIKYKTHGTWNISLGAESYFFQEGQAHKYAGAKYGGLMVDESGNSILVGLYDEHFRLMGK